MKGHGEAQRLKSRPWKKHRTLQTENSVETNMFLNQLNTATTFPETAPMDVDVVMLPDHLVYEILLRLPVKSLMTFRTVSRHWRDTISSGKFAMDHCTRSQESVKRGCYYVISYHCYNGSSSITLYPATGKPFKMDVQKMFKDIISSRIYIQSSCLGLLCAVLHRMSLTYVIILNPVTQEFWVPLETVKTFGYECYVSGEKYALGFDPARHEYKVVRLTWSMDTQLPKNYQIDVMSLKSKSVKRIEDKTQYMPLPTNNAVSIDGYIFWLASGLQPNNNAEAILKFDLARDHLSPFLIPPEATSKTEPHEYIRLSLYECNGSIRLVRWSCNSNLSWCIKYIWLLSTVDESWKDVTYCYKAAALCRSFSRWERLVGLTSDSVIVFERKAGFENRGRKEEGGERVRFGCEKRGRKEEGVERVVWVGGSLNEANCHYLHWVSLVSPRW